MSVPNPPNFKASACPIRPTHARCAHRRARCAPQVLDPPKERARIYRVCPIRPISLGSIRFSRRAFSGPYGENNLGGARTLRVCGLVAHTRAARTAKAKARGRAALLTAGASTTHPKPLPRGAARVAGRRSQPCAS